MVYIFIEMISTVLLLSSSLLLYIWKNGFNQRDYKLIKNIGTAILLIGVYKLLDVINYFYNLSEYVSSITKLTALIGLVLLMFSLFNYLEVKKK